MGVFKSQEADHASAEGEEVMRGAGGVLACVIMGIGLGWLLHHAEGASCSVS